MLKYTLLFAFTLASLANGQDFETAIQNVISQWGQITPDQFLEFFNNFQQTGLNHIWHGINEHCSSNAECGPDACCLKPTIHGRRAITDGSQIHLGSYCAKLRKAGETCSTYDINQHYYNFHCPCASGLKCVAGSSVVMHPLLVIPTQAICK